MVLWDLFAKHDYQAFPHFRFLHPFQLAETKEKTNTLLV